MQALRRTLRTTKISTSRRFRSGQAVVLATASIVVLIGFAALAVDIGMFYATRRRMQSAADAAAIAGAGALLGSSSVAAGYATAAQDVAKLDGFQNSQNGITVTATKVSCPGASSQQCVQVNVSQAVPTYFLRALGYSTMNVSTQAIAGGVNSSGCVYALDPTKSSAVGLTGTLNINMSCGMLVDSSSSTGLNVTGTATITTTGVGVAGNGYGSTGTITWNPTPVTNIAPAPDPLASLAAPTFSAPSLLATNQSYCEGYTGTSSSAVNIPAGIYPTSPSNPSKPPLSGMTYGCDGTDGISITGTFNNGVTFAAGNYGGGIVLNGTGSVNLNPGQYQMASGGSYSLKIVGTTNVTMAAGNYTFDGPVLLTGTGNVTLSPGVYCGGIDITGTTKVTFNPGEYIIGGNGLVNTGTSTMTGSGVSFYNTTCGSYAYAPIDITGTVTASLSAPTSGSMAGILFFDRNTGTGTTVTGTSSSTYEGVLYFPNSSLTYTGTSSSAACNPSGGTGGYTDIIADTITFTGTSTISVCSDYSSLGGKSPISSDTIYQ
ncbi:MAG TPA: pilus assembly protein TadG-related protein [Candidatus Binataceae bacterium]|nr:pilus assembly protein TadG-related protein [Candidatus Binataceae bacterium]